MRCELFSFGPLCAAYKGDLSLLDGSLLRRFAASGGTPAFTVTLRRGQLPDPPSLPQIAPSVYRTETGWHRRFSAVYGGRRLEYAALNYTEDAAELTVSPVCRNLPACVEGCAAFEHLALCAGALPLHASHIQIGGTAIVFTAQSGTGKSTQAALWEQYRGARVVNGDKSLLVKTPRGFVAAGLPYAGTSGICHNAAAPLRAVVALEQGRENRLTRLHGAQAAMRLMAGVIRSPWDEADARRALALTAELVETTPVFLLRCLPDETAVRCLWKALFADLQRAEAPE